MSVQVFNRMEDPVMTDLSKAQCPSQRVKDWKTRMPAAFTVTLDENGELIEDLQAEIVACWWVADLADGARSVAVTNAVEGHAAYAPPIPNLTRALRKMRQDFDALMKARRNMLRTWERLAKAGYTATSEANYRAWKGEVEQ